MTMRRLGGLLLLATIAAIAPATAGAKSTITPAQGEKFPERKWVLRLPTQQVLDTSDVTVTENGRPVNDLRVAPASGSGTFGVILAIDTSPSMRSRDAIGAAMAAARAFAEQRPAAHRLGVVFFSGDTRVALAPTTDAARIDQVLAARPPLTEGTRMYDAVGAGFDALKQAGISAGSVVLLSDGCRLRAGRCLGADAGSRLDHKGTIELARRSKSRVFTVGLRSKSYDGAPLHALAADTGGDYAEASSPRRLEQVFDRLGERLAGEHVIAYRSLSRLARDITVRVEVAGRDPAVAVYRSPSLASQPPAIADQPSGWAETWVAVAFALLVSGLLGLVVYLVVRPRTRSAAVRIAQFTGTPLEELQGVTAGRSSLVLQGAERSLARMRGWPRFVEEVDVARVSATPVQIALGTIAATIALVWFFGSVAGRPLVAGFLLVGIPFGVVRFVHFKAGRQRRHFEELLPDNLQVIASAMRAGHSFAGALGVSVEDASEPARRELRRVVNDERLGVPVEKAIDQAARRMDNRELEHVALVSQLQRDVGGNTAEVLDRLVETIRANADVRRLVRTLTSQGRLSGTIVSALPVAVLLVINVLNPDYLDPLLRSTAGHILLGLAAFGVTAGWLVIRRIVDIKV